jgi:hypothetical protein
MQKAPVVQRQQQQQSLQNPYYLTSIGAPKLRPRPDSSLQKWQDLVIAQARMQSGEL